MTMTMPPDINQRYAILLDMARRISRTFDLSQILHHLLDSVRLVVPFDAAGVFVLNRSLGLPDDPDRVVGAMASVGFDAGPLRDDPMLRFGKGIIGQVIRSGRAHLSRDVRDDPYYVNARPQTMSELAVPIASNGKVIGALNLESDSLDGFRESDAIDLSYFAVVAAISIEKAVLHHQVVQKQHIDHHLALAREVQANLLPSASPRIQGYDVAGVNIPTLEIGGDYYDFLPLRDGRLAVVVADVSGKGMAAALIMATFRAALRSELRRTDSVESVIRGVDELLLESIDPSRYVTALYGILDPASGEFRYVNCGHTPPLLLRADGTTECLERGRPALGMPIAAAEDSGSVWLERGDTLVVYTDGVVELCDGSDAEFGVARLEQVVRSRCDFSADAIVREVRRATLDFCARPAYEDDFTLVVVKRE